MRNARVLKTSGRPDSQTLVRFILERIAMRHSGNELAAGIEQRLFDFGREARLRNPGSKALFIKRSG